MTSYLGQKQITEYIATRHGISNALSKRIFQDTCDVILVGLLLDRYDHTSNVPRLGTFRLDSVNQCILFDPSSSRLKLIEASLNKKKLPDIEDSALVGGETNYE